MSEDPHRCYVRGMYLQELLSSVEDDAEFLKLPEEVRRQRRLIGWQSENVKKNIVTLLDSAVQALLNQQCLKPEVRNHAHEVLVNLSLSAKQDDYVGMDERLYDLMEYIGMSRFHNPCVERSFEATDEAGHKMRAVVAVDKGERVFSVCHTEDGAEHVCYTDREKPDDQYRFVKQMFQAWGFKMQEVEGESCL